MQISAIILYGAKGQKRILPFKVGAVNIITGKSKTGKSVIGDIIDYCMGGTSCNIAEGFVREHVEWYALQLIHNEEYIIVGRENPPRGQASTNRCCYLIGTDKIPDDLSSATPVDNGGLEKILSADLIALRQESISCEALRVCVTSIFCIMSGVLPFVRFAFIAVDLFFCHSFRFSQTTYH